MLNRAPVRQIEDRQRLGQQHVERAIPGVFKHRLNTGPQDHAGLGERGIPIGLHDGPALTDGHFIAKPQLILDRGRTLVVGRIAGIKSYAGHSLSPFRPVLSTRTKAGKRKVVIGGPSVFPAGKLFAGDLAAQCARQGKHQYASPHLDLRIDRPVIVGRDNAAGFRLRHGCALSTLERTNLNDTATLAQDLMQHIEKPRGQRVKLPVQS